MKSRYPKVHHKKCLLSSIQISLKFAARGLSSTIPSFLKIMACRPPGDKPLSEPIMVSLLTHICVTRLQWVNCPPAQQTFDVFLQYFVSDNGLSHVRHKTLPETMLVYYQVTPWEWVSVTSIKWLCKKFHTRKLIWKSRLQNDGHFI